jgi:hypothetical protein
MTPEDEDRALRWVGRTLLHDRDAGLALLERLRTAQFSDDLHRRLEALIVALADRHLPRH